MDFHSEWFRWMQLSNLSISIGSQSFKMGNQKILIFIVFMIDLTHILCNYNRISINNVDVCRENKKKGVREKISKYKIIFFKHDYQSKGNSIE